MSSTSRFPDDQPESSDEDKKKPVSPGRYCLADEGEVPPNRIDSTARMPAVRAELLRSRSRSDLKAPKIAPPEPAPPSQSEPTVGRPDGNAPPPVTSGTRRAIAPPSARAASLPIQPGSPPTETATSAGAATAPKSDEGAPSTVRRPPPLPPRPPAAAPHASRRRVSSLRPPPVAPPSADPLAPGDMKDASSAAGGEVTLDGFDEGSIAFAFDALISDEVTGQPGTHEFDLTPVRELFSELAANHMRHVRDFMIDVKWGQVTRDWIDICVPPVRTLRRAAQRLDLIELGEALAKLASELDAANATGGQVLDAVEKQRLLVAYGALVEILPQAFALDTDKTKREAVIVQGLLLQVPDVRKVTIDKLHAAGLTSLTVLFDARADDIANVAGVPHALASRIVDRVQAYRDELKSASPQDARAAEREKLGALNARLKAHHDAYEDAATGWTPEAKSKKRDEFRAREETWLEISVLLARFGEIERLQGIEKVPFAQRIAQLSDYLAEAREKYRAGED